MRRWRTITALATAAILAGGLGYRLLRRPEIEPAAPASARPAPSIPRLATRAEAPKARAVDPALADPGPGEHLAYYGGLSGRLSPSAVPDPDTRPFQVTSAGAAPTLIAWADRTLVQAGDRVTLTARFVDDSGATLVDATVDVSVRAGERALTLPMRLVQPAQQGQQGTERWQATFVSDDPRLALDPHVPTDVDFIVRARRGAGDEAVVRTALGVVAVQRPGARLAADSARVERRGEDIVLQIAADVAKPGTYWAIAELWGGADGARPIAFGRRTLGKLAPGRQPFELLFGGRIVRDVGLSPPYVIRNVRLVQIDTTPPHVAPPISVVPWPS